jgi:hypothetical protein
VLALLLCLGVHSVRLCDIHLALLPFIPPLVQVSIDANGVLKVTHLVPLAGQAGRAAPQASSWAASLPAMSAHTQGGGMSGSQTAVVQFVSLPVEEDE